MGQMYIKMEVKLKWCITKIPRCWSPI